MPSKSDKQRRYIFALRSKYKSKSNTPKEDMWIWEKDWDKIQEKKKSQIVGYNQQFEVMTIIRDGKKYEIRNVGPIQYKKIKDGKIDIDKIQGEELKEDEHVGNDYINKIKKRKDDTTLITPTLYPDVISTATSNIGENYKMSYVEKIKKLEEKHLVKSIIEKGIQGIYHSKSVEEAKKVFYDLIDNSGIKEVDKRRMLGMLDNLKSLVQVQKYATNAMLKFEGLGLKESTLPHDEEHLLSWFEMMHPKEIKIWADFQRKYGNKTTSEKLIQHSMTGLSFNHELDKFQETEIEHFLNKHKLTDIYNRMK